MKIILATGIYPPDIGGPATYTKNLAKELAENFDLTVITYGKPKQSTETDPWKVIRIPTGKYPLGRWQHYKKALIKYGKEADIIYAFSSVSCGVPLLLANLKKPKKILRLGGDFFWERYTALGGEKNLKEWHQSFLFRLLKPIMVLLLKQFDHLVFSTKYQQKIYQKYYSRLPLSSVIENPSPQISDHFGAPAGRPHKPFRLLFMGRLVGFKNLPNLIAALKNLPGITLTIIGHGPKEKRLRGIVHSLRLQKRIDFKKPAHGQEKIEIFNNHDLLVIPSLTEISPNVALEAAAFSLPVLLTTETGLSINLLKGMVVRPLITSQQIEKALRECLQNYDQIISAIQVIPGRDWSVVTKDHFRLFSSLGF